MEPSADKPTSPQKGDLEYLFRQKFEEAEFQPRASLWEQLDHELVVQQNETFRERLRVHRWVAAACVLFMLSMGGWFARHFTSTHEAELAVGQEPTNSRNASGNAAKSARLAVQVPASTLNQPASAATSTTSASFHSESAAAGSAATQLAAARASGISDKERLAGNATPNRTGTAVLASGRASRTLPTNTQAVNTSSATEAASPQGDANRQAAQGRNTFLGYAANSTAQGRQQEAAGQLRPTGATPPPSASAGLSAFSRNTAVSTVAAATPGAAVASAIQPPAGIATDPVEVISPRAAALHGTLAALPSSLDSDYTPNALAWADALAAKDEKQLAKNGSWSLGGGHNLSSFNPNINFSRGSVSAANLQNASPTVRVNSQMYEEGATEYRKNLQAGLGQRVALLARRKLSSRWSVAAGVEAAEYRASSQTSYAAMIHNQQSTFTGDLQQSTRIRTQMATDLTVLSEPQTTRYRYRTAGLPVSLQYGATDKAGWSLYARMGAAVNVLFGSRLSPENPALVSQREYNLKSADSPYRHVLASLRGGAGMQYRPAGAAWMVALGPAAEAGLNTMNANPTQSYWQQNRPYSVGLEASVEFGVGKPMAAAH
ncbi:hypothetical protein [Hymenobacter sp. BT730]|uniref:hypothetical protein n=1 Tax=Hymenobacter sp. BT730 TaxID=3063332 RepID=UPI0026E01DF6|nr:hypothetical protein [Hymenobacter sp. BT730]